MQMSHQMPRKHVIVITIILVLILLTASFLVREAERPGHPIEFETVADIGRCNWSYYDQRLSGRMMVIRNRASWDESWNELTGLSSIWQPPAIENISWDHEMVLVASYGVASDLQKDVHFTSVRQDGITVYAYVRWINETPGIILPMAHCPAHAIVVESSPEVVFVEDRGTEYVLNWRAAMALIVLATAAIVLYFRGPGIGPVATGQSQTKEAGQ